MLTSVLVAERNPALLNEVARSLESSGFLVQTAQDGLECLAKFRESLPDVAVIDRGLPWGGGDGVAAWLREESLSPVAVVMLVEMSSEIEQIDSGRLWVRKPFHMTTLTSAIEAAARSGRRRHASLVY